MAIQHEITDLLIEAKEALMNRDPATREKECYSGKPTNCECTLCSLDKMINKLTYDAVLIEGSQSTDF